jgi:predicted ATP-grasp superfamily ATP-dependent carboligase
MTFSAMEKDHARPLGSPRDLAPSIIAQEYVEGIAASVAFLIGPRRRTALAPCRQNISDDGRLSYLGGSLPLPEELAMRAVSLATRAVDAVNGLFSYVGVDLVLAEDARNDCIIEINPRLTTSYVGLRRLARFNIAEELLRLVRGEESRTLAWRQEAIAFLPDGRVVEL